MATEVLMPRQGQSVESCIIVAWKKQEGESVSEGETLCEVETDKATFEVEAPTSGTLLKQLYADGDEVPVLEQIAFIGDAGEHVPSGTASEDTASAGADSSGDGSDTDKPDEGGAVVASGSPPGEAAQTGGSTAGDSGSPGSDREEGRPADADGSPTPDNDKGRAAGGERFISPRARSRAERAGVPWHTLSGTGPGGRIIERDIEAAIASGTVSTRAAAAGTSAAATGTGPGGRVTTADVAASSSGEAPGEGRRAAAGTPADASGASSAGANARPAGGRDRTTHEVQLTGIRKKISERMLASVQNSAQLTLHSSGDARALLAYRRRLKAAGAPFDGISLNDMVLFAVSRLLPKHPTLNATFDGQALQQHGAVHLGMAVDTDRGLMVPVVRDADLQPLASLSAESKRLASACRSGSISADEMSGGSFTITNLGAMGVEMFTPVLNPPQVAILGVCSIQAKPVIQSDGSVEHIPHMGFSLTIDHRVVDGAPAGRFLSDLSQSVSQFDLLLSDAGLVEVHQ